MRLAMFGMIVLLLVIASSQVYAQNTQPILNPFTGRLTLIRSSDFTGENLSADNMTADFFFGDGSSITGVTSINCTLPTCTGTDKITFNGTVCLCEADADSGASGAIHDINDTNHTGNLSTSRVVKDTGTNFIDLLLDIILDQLFTRDVTLNTTINSLANLSISDVADGLNNGTIIRALNISWVQNQITGSKNVSVASGVVSLNNTNITVANATFSSDSALLAGSAPSTYLVNTNCSAEGSCSLITYDTELNNITIIRATNTSWFLDIINGSNNVSVANGVVSINSSAMKFDNATYSDDSALLGGDLPDVYLDDTNTNCSVLNSCNTLIYSNNETWAREQLNGSQNISIDSGIITVNASFSTGAHTIDTNCTLDNECPLIHYDSEVSDHANRTDQEIIDVINESQVTVQCEQMNFSGTIGSAGICDGTDASAGNVNGTTINLTKLYIYPLVNCDTINTTPAGELVCGNDLAGAGSTEPHTMNGTNHTGNLSAVRVVKDSGTNYIDELLDIIIDALFSRDESINNSVVAINRSVESMDNISLIDVDGRFNGSNNISVSSGIISLNNTNITVANATYCVDSALLAGDAPSLFKANCSVANSCPLLVYGTNVTWVAAQINGSKNVSVSSTGIVSLNNTNITVANATYCVDSALLAGSAPSTYLDENASWNRSYADTLYAGAGNASWNQTHANTLYAAIGDAGNASWNESRMVGSNNISILSGVVSINSSAMKFANATFCDDSALLANTLPDVYKQNCSTEGICSLITYDTELNNITLIRSTNISWVISQINGSKNISVSATGIISLNNTNISVANASYCIDSALLGGDLPSIFKANCSVLGSCPTISYDDEIDNLSIIRIINFTWAQNQINGSKNISVNGGIVSLNNTNITVANATYCSDSSQLRGYTTDQDVLTTSNVIFNNITVTTNMTLGGNVIFDNGTALCFISC